MTCQALCFDVFGTTVDWHGSIVASLTSMRPHLSAIWPSFVRSWREKYRPAMDQVRRGSSFIPLDTLHLANLKQTLEEFKLQAEFAPAELEHVNSSWHHLTPWPDVLGSLHALRGRNLRLCTLSNGDNRLLANMAAHSALPWTDIFSAETFGHYKPDKECYLGACKLLNLPPSQVAMVACHKGDLVHAQSHGMKTIYVKRPLEWGGPHAELDSQTDDARFDLNVESFEPIVHSKLFASPASGL